MEDPRLATSVDRVVVPAGLPRDDNGWRRSCMRRMRDRMCISNVVDDNAGF